MICTPWCRGLRPARFAEGHCPRHAHSAGRRPDDYIFDISITANRADCQSVLGIAREVAAVLNKPLKMPATDYTVSDYVDPRLSISVEAEDLCPRYIGHYVRNITPGESPTLDAPSAGPVRSAQHLQRR